MRIDRMNYVEMLQKIQHFCLDTKCEECLFNDERKCPVLKLQGTIIAISQTIDLWRLWNGQIGMGNETRT